MKAILALVVSALMFTQILAFMPLIAAPSHPVFIDGDGTDIIYDGGTTPDDPFYFLDTMFDGLQSPESVTAEKLAEFRQMIEEGRYEEAEEAAHEFFQALDNYEEKVDTISDVETIVEHEALVLSHEGYVEGIKELLVAAVDSGEIIEEQASATGIDQVQEEIVEAVNDVELQKEEVIETVALDAGITKLEVELDIVEPLEEDAGITDYYSQDVSEELPALDAALSEIKQEFEAAKDAGEVVNEVAIEEVIEAAELKLQSSENEYEHGQYDDAFDKLTDAEHLILNADLLLEEKPIGILPSEEQQARIEVEVEQLNVDPESIRAEIEAEERSYVEDYENIREELRDKYPDRYEDFESRYEIGKKAIELAEKLKDEYSVEYERLSAEQGAAEATRILTERFAEEFQRVYGEPFIPPGYVPPEGVEITPIGTLDIGGGFIEGHEYVDPVSGYTYTFHGNYYEYETPYGFEYSEKYPEGYVPPTTYKEGNEIYTYQTESEEGTVTYTYTATGYEVTKPDGTKETYAYPEGTYQVHGGGEFVYEPTGFEYHPPEGETITYEYNPEYKTYASSTGIVYTPEEGTYWHDYHFDYDESAGKYEYDYGTEGWTYDPNTNLWTSASGETYTPSATTYAPVGYESSGGYTTEHGETWTYDSSSGTWTSSSGTSYTQSSGEYTGSSGESYTYAYDPATGSYTYSYPSGETYSYTYDPSTGSYSYTGPSGESYSGYSEGSYSGGSYDSGSYSGGYSGGDS
ncbi:MAG: hypothetical protein AABX59_03675, partial [Nanoarchaeota archaeon]